MALLVAVLFSLGCALLWYGMYWLSYTSRKKQTEQKGQPFNPLWVKIFYLFHGIVGQVMYWVLILAVHQSAGLNQYYALNGTAYTIFQTVQNYQIICDKEEKECNINGIYQFSEKPPEDDFQTYMQKTLHDYSGWYAVVCDENHHLEYVLNSKHELTSEEIHPPDSTEQKKIMTSFFRNTDDAIGYYFNKNAESQRS